MDKALERATSFYQDQILFNEKRAQESWWQLCWLERKLNEQRIEYDNNKQVLMKVKFKFQLFSRNRPAPALWHTAHRDLKRLKFFPIIRAPRKEEGHVGKAQGPKITCRFNSVSQQPVPKQLQPQHDIWLYFPLLKVFYLFSLAVNQLML